MGIKDLFNKLRGKGDESLSPFSLSEEIVETQEEPQPSIKEEGDKAMNRTSNYATGKAIATGQITLVDLTDIISQPTAPTPAKENMLWMDTSKTPPVLMVYKNGAWVKENDFKNDPQYSVITETMKKNTADIEVNKEQIALKVSQTEVTNTVITEIGKLEIGSGNFILDSSFIKKEDSYSSDGNIVIQNGEAVITNATHFKMSLGSSFGALKRADDVVLSSIATITSSEGETGLNKVIGGNINVYSEDYTYIVNSAKTLKLNLITVPIAVTVTNGTSNPIVPDWALNRTRAYLTNLKNANLLTNKTRLIFEPHLLINDGSVSETEYNPPNKEEFFLAWKNIIISCLTSLSEYEFYGIYIGTNFQQFDTGEDNMVHWRALVKSLKTLYNNHQLIYRTNWWTTASWSEELKTAYEAKVNNPLWGMVDVISIAAYFELNDKAVPTSDELFNDIMNGTSLYGRGQKVFEEVKRFYDVWKKPVMFGELGCPSKEHGAMYPWSNLTENKDNQVVQANLFDAYNRAFIYDNGIEDNSWFLGYSIFTLGTPSSEYNIIGKTAEAKIIQGINFIENNSVSMVKALVKNKTTNTVIAELNLPLSPAMNSVESTSTKLIYDGNENSEIVFQLAPSTTFTLAKPMFASGTKAVQWSPSVQDSEHRFTEINDKFTGIDAQLGQMDLVVKDLSTADYVKNIKNNTSISLFGIGENQTNKEIWKKVENSFADITLEGKTLVNLTRKENYLFSSDSVNTSKYTKEESINQVKVTIKEALTSWSYVASGSIKKEMIKPNTKYTIFFDHCDGITNVTLRTGSGSASWSNSVNIQSGRAVITTNTLTPTTDRIFVWCAVSTTGSIFVNNCTLVEGVHDRLEYFEDMRSVGSNLDSIFISSYEGIPNLLLNSDFHITEEDSALGWDQSKNGNLKAEYWSFYNPGVSQAETGYHAHLYKMENGDIVVRYVEQTGRWQSATYNVPPFSKKNIKRGKKYTYSFDMYGDTLNSELFGGMYYTKRSGGNPGFYSGQYSFKVSEVGKWKRYSFTFVMPEDIRTDLGINFYNYGDRGKGTTYAKNFKLEEYETMSNYCLATDEASNDSQKIEYYNGTDWNTPLLNSAGDIKDRIVKSEIDGQYSFKKRTQYKVFTGANDESWVLTNNETTYKRFGIEIVGMSGNRSPISSNLFMLKDNYNLNISEGIFTSVNGNTLYVDIHKDKASTLSDFKKYIAQNNLQVVYPLKREISYSCKPLNIKSYGGGSFYVDGTVPPTTLHSVPLNALASVESAISSINISKNQIEQKVDVNGVIAAINIGIVDDESNIKIMADRIKLKGAVTIEALSDNLSQIFETGSDTTVINGGYIKSGTIDLSGELWSSGISVYEKRIGSDGNLETDADGNFIRGEQSFSISDRGEVNIKGNIQSMNFNEDENTGWKIGKDGIAIFNQGEFRSKIILPRAGMSNEGNIRIWAGGDNPGTALFRVLDSGDCYIEKGFFAGVFSGTVEVGGISITDEGKNTGRASIRITDNLERLVTEIADDNLTIGTDTHIKNRLIVDDNGVKINGADFNFNNKIKLKSSDSSISFNDDFANFKVNGTKFDFKVNDSSQSTDFEFSNSRRDTIVEIKGQLKVSSNVDIGVVTIRKQSEGIDFLFI